MLNELFRMHGQHARSLWMRREAGRCVGSVCVESVWRRRVHLLSILMMWMITASSIVTYPVNLLALQNSADAAQKTDVRHATQGGRIRFEDLVGKSGIQFRLMNSVSAQRY